MALTVLSLTALAQKEETITGNGKMVSRDVAVSSFSSLKASGLYELKLSQGDKESVRIETDENLQEYFTVRNEGSKLMIEMKKGGKNIKPKSKAKVYVSFKQLKDLELATIGNVEAKEELRFSDLSLTNRAIGNVDLRLSADKMNIYNSSVGNIKLTGQAQNAVIRNSGVGSLEAGSMVVQTMNIENTGVGHAEVNAQKELKVKDSMTGKVTNKGAAAVRRMNKVKV